MAFPFPTPLLAALKTALAPRSHPLSPAPKQFYAVARAALLRSTPRGRACCRWPWATAQIQLRIIPPGLRCLHTRIYCGSMSLHRVLAEQARAVLGDRCAKGPRTPARAPFRVRLCRESTIRTRELPTAARRRTTPLQRSLRRWRRMLLRILCLRSPGTPRASDRRHLSPSDLSVCDHAASSIHHHRARL